MGGKKKKPVRAATGMAWKRFALVSVLLNAVLAAALFLVSRGGAGEEQEAVSRFIDTYFQTWSRQDMVGYGNCFHPEAVIHFIDANGVPRGSALEPFIDGQRLVHTRSEVPMREIPLSKTIEIDGNVARALVRWKLFNESGEEVGTDYFSLVKTKTGWKIVSLMFRKDG